MTGKDPGTDIHALDADMFAEVHLALSIPFKNGFLTAPEGGEQPDVGIRGGYFKNLPFFLTQELARNPPDGRHRDFDIDTYPASPAHDSGGIIPAMGYGELVFLAGKKGLAGVGQPDQVVRKAGKKELQQEPACQVLQALVGMGHIPVQGHRAFEKGFRFLYLPDSKAGVIVDLLLKKNRHRSDLRIKIADLIAIPETFLKSRR